MMAAGDSRKARKIPASRELQSRIGSGTINEDVVEKAQNVIESNEVDFAPMAQSELEKVQQVLKRVKAENADNEAAIKEVTLPIMNLKANAATFNYPVISSIAGTVLSLLEEFDSFNSDLIKIVDNMHKAILVALLQNMRGEPGDAGNMLINEFREVCKAYLTKAKSN